MADDLFEIDQVNTDRAPRSSCGCRSNPARAARRSRVATGTCRALRVAAPPIEGRANAQCIELVAEGLRSPQVPGGAGRGGPQPPKAVAHNGP